MYSNKQWKNSDEKQNQSIFYDENVNNDMESERDCRIIQIQNNRSITENVSVNQCDVA